MQYERGNGAARKKAYIQKQKKLKKARRRKMMVMSVTWALLALNVFFLVSIYENSKAAEKDTELADSEIKVNEEEQPEKEQGGRENGEEIVANPPVEEIEIVDLIEPSYADTWGLESVEKPVDRSPAQVLQRLKELGADNEMIREVYENHIAYPEKLLKALANNPEMVDFVRNYKGTVAAADGEMTKQEKEEEFPLFLQWDPRWGYQAYGDNSSIAVAGCGPTCLSMVLYSLTGNEELTPDKIAEYSMEQGYYMPGTGTLWKLFTEVPLVYGVSVEQTDKLTHDVEASLDAGKVVVCSMRPGDFTDGGHFIVLYDYDENGFFVNDPNCVARSRRQWTFEELKGQVKQVWTFNK